ncbi:MAG TPA: hypothetical protein VK327_17875 [Candidatus Paceibacterota bacterium]|nr:hypothetical protein [Candidatus Paceibacterota bacterium]
MKRHLAVGTFALLLGALLTAQSAPADDVKSAVAKLADNYSWKTTTEIGGDQGFTMVSEGKTAKGISWLSRTAQDMTIEAYLSGTNKGAIKTPEGWRTLAEAAEDDGGGFNPIMFTSRILQQFRSPATEAAELAGQTEFKTDGDAVGGGLTEAAVKKLLTFRLPGRKEPKISDDKGSAKFWVKDGRLAKYQFTVSGKLTVDDEERDVNHTVTVEFKDVGTTKVEVPDEVKKKLQ